MRPAPGAQAGFTLLEILAAFVIFALVFATTLQVLSGAMRNTQRSSDYTQAALWAQTAMESLGIEPPLEEGRYSGRFEDGYAWEMDITPFEIDSLQAPAPAAAGEDAALPAGTSLGGLTELEVPIDLFEVELRIYWGEAEERMARFTTLRSATPEP